MAALRTLAGILVLLACSPAAQGQTATGGHFRYATMFWRSVETNPPSNTVEITIESAWRRSYSSNYFTAAQMPTGETLMQINGAQSPVLELGDGMIKYLESVRITAWSAAEDWFLGEQVFTHTYDTPSNAGAPWLVKFKGCCRMSTLLNNADAAWEMHMNISRTEVAESPRVITLPVIFAQQPSAGLPSQVFFNLRTANMSDSVGFSLAVPGSSAPASYNTLAARVTVSPTGNVSVSTLGVGTVNILAYAHDAAHPSIKVPIDFLVTISAASPTDPQFSADALTLFQARQTLHPGFEYTADISGFTPTPPTDPAAYVGFTIGPLPAGAHLSAVRGKGRSPADPATVTFRWTPCTAQMGTTVVCFDVVNSVGIAATQKCLVLNVVPDPSPTIGGYLGGAPLGQSVTLYIGASYMFQITAHDANAGDALTIGPSTPAGGACAPPDCLPLPPGAVLTPPTTSHTPGGVMASINISFTALHNHGGYSTQHCFATRDACGGGCSPPPAAAGAAGGGGGAPPPPPAGGAGGGGGGDACPGVVQAAVVCVMVNVARCQFIVRQGQELQEIAAVYRSDWLQLWSLNQQLLSPDTQLMPGSVIAIGHTYAVQPFDKASEVAKRFGMDPEMFHTLNADMPVERQTTEICTSVSSCGSLYWCVLPSSCKGDSGSIYQGAYQNQPWFAAAKDANPMPPVGAVPSPSGA